MTTPLFPIQNFVAKPYAGTLRGVPVSLLTKGGVNTNDGQTIQQGHQSKCATAIIDFLSTVYKGQAVSINLQSGANAQPIAQILMIYVDNELNSQDVTVGFPDTLQYIGVPAFTTGYYPVLTGGMLCTVYNGTSGKIPVTSASQVSVIFCDFAIPGFLSQETLDITVNSSTGPVIPTIGDRVQTNTIGSTNNNPAIVLATVVAPKQYVVTGIQISAFNMFLDGAPTTEEFYAGVYLFDTNPFVFTPMRCMIFDMAPDWGDQRFFVLCDETGLNIPCQGLEIQFANEVGIVQPIPAWAKLTVSITYALVTL